MSRVIYSLSKFVNLPCFTPDSRTTLEEANFSYTLPCYVIASSFIPHLLYTIVLRTLIDNETTKE